jgi:hypothetical protein
MNCRHLYHDLVREYNAIAMTVQTAFRILRLNPDSNHQDLMASYRKLVKRYHPDFNSERKDWSHSAMTKINLAYELVRVHIKNAGVSSGSTGPAATATANRAPTGTATSAAPGPRQRTPEQRFREDISEGFSRQPAEDPAFVALFDRSAELVLGGIYTYYQYGLQNVYLRHEGVRRYRYRSAVKRVRDGVQELSALDALATLPENRLQLDVFAAFARAFLQNMLIERYHISDGNRSETLAYRHYFTGSESLDEVIRAELFEELKERRAPNGVAGGLKVGYHELMSVLVRHSTSNWVAEAVIKLHLLETFTRVVALRQQN